MAGPWMSTALDMVTCWHRASRKTVTDTDVIYLSGIKSGPLEGRLCRSAPSGH